MRSVLGHRREQLMKGNGRVPPKRHLRFRPLDFMQICTSRFHRLKEDLEVL